MQGTPAPVMLDKVGSLYHRPSFRPIYSHLTSRRAICPNQLNIIVDLRSIAHDAANAAELAELMAIVASLITAAHDTDERIVDRILPF